MDTRMRVAHNEVIPADKYFFNILFLGRHSTIVTIEIERK